MDPSKESYEETGTYTSLKERISEFSKHAYIAMKKDSSRHQDHRLLKPVIFDFCNASLPRSFSHADTNYRNQKDTFHYDIWFMHSFKELLRVLAGGEIQNEYHMKFKNLIDLFFSDKHTTCFQELSSLINNGKVTELKLKTIMALHYFKPLVPNSSYIIDKCYQSHLNVCEFCKETMNFGDTSIGNSQVWHGKVDILLEKSVVKVNLETDIGDISLKEDRSEDESEDSDASEDEENKSDLLTKNMKKGAKCQIIAQAIVNAFYNSSRDKSLFEQFVPSFLVTEKSVRVVLYNCKLDVLLMSTKMPIWKKEGSAELDLMTLIRVWLALNYSDTMDKQPEEYKFVLDHTSISRFQNLISAEAYSIYLRDLQQPMIGGKLSDLGSETSDDEIESNGEVDTRAFKLKCLLELNNEVNKLKKT